eukprot:c19134_g2_i1 orf=155-1573(+)
MGDGHADQFLDTFDMMFAMVDFASPHALEDMKLLESPNGSSFTPGLLSPYSLNSSEHSMHTPTFSMPCSSKSMSKTVECEDGNSIPNPILNPCEEDDSMAAPTFSIPCRSKSMLQIVECEDGDWIPNPTLNPDRKDDSITVSSSDIFSLIRFDLKMEDEYYTSKGISDNVSQSDKELHSLHSIKKRAPSPAARDKKQRRIWGVSSTRNRKIGAKMIQYCEPYKKKSSMDVQPSCVSKKMVATSDAGRKRGTFTVKPSESGRLLEHLDSDNRDRMEDIVLDGNNTKCKDRAMSRNMESGRQRQQKLNDKLYSLRALVPKISKMDKATIVKDNISYVQELKRQPEVVQEEVSYLANGLINTKTDFTGTGRRKASRKVVSHHPHHQILKFSVTHMQGQIYHLQIDCKRSGGVLLQLAQAIEALDFDIVNANSSTINDHILNNLTIEVKEKRLLGKQEVHSEIMKSMSRFGCTYDF